MKINIYSLRGVDYSGEIKSLNVKTLAGEITILDHHRPLVSVLKAGELKLVDTLNKSQNIPIKGGFLEVRPENIVNISVNL